MPGILGTEYIACTKSTVLAVTRNFSTYSWGLIPDYTSLNSSLSLPVQITTLKSKRVREIKCLRDSFVICSDHVIPNSYITNIPLGTIDAGKKHVMNLNLIDSNLMFINDPLDKIGVLAFNSNGGISKGEISAYWDNSKHIIEAKLTGAGHHTIYVFCNSLQLKNSPFIYTVGHGNFTYCKGFVSSESLLINAGVGFVMLIKAYDRFDNLVTNDPELVFSSSVDGRCEIIDFEEGCYRVVVYCTEIGKHEMVMKCNGRAFEIVLQDFTRAEPVEVKVQGFVNVQVLPGIISPSHCTVEGLKHEYIAGEVISFFIVSRDQYNNTTWHRSKPWCIDSALSFSLQESADYCSTYITAVSLKSCKIPLKLSYDNHNLISTEIHIIPGPMHLPFTVVNKCGNPIFTEKSTREILIEFYDQYCNPCPYSPNVKSPCKFTIKNYEFYKCSIEYYVEIPGVYSFHIETDQGPLEIKVVHDKDPQVLQREQYEKARLEWELQKIAEEEEKKQQAEQKLRETQESQRKLLLKEKQKAVEALEKQQKIMESEELDRRLRVIARIKAQEVTKKRGLDALLKLEEEKKQKVQKKWKRIGGGFTVPFITDE